MLDQSWVDELSLREAAQALQDGIVARATGGEMSSGDYSDLRDRLMEDPRSKPYVPSFVRTCRSPAQIWAHASESTG
jgi:hypothetical protein